MAKNRKIIIVAPFPPPFGGIARYAQDLWESERLNREFDLHRIDVAKGERFLHGEGRSDRSWSRVSYFLRPVNWLFWIYLVYSLFEYLWKLASVKPNAVHVHTSSYFGFIRSGFYLFFARPFCKRRILHLHNAIDVFYAENQHRKAIWKLVLWCMHQATEYVVLSEGLGKWLKENLDIEATVIWNACHSANFVSHDDDKQSFRSNFPEAADKTVVILIGGLYPHKGAFDLLAVVADMRPEEREGLIFILPGKGERSKAVDFIAKHGLENYVLIPGMIPEEDKDNLVRSSDIFVLPSYAEGQPIAILEAMSASLPIITTNIASIPEVVEHDVMGKLITPGDQAALKEGILQLSKEPNLRRQMGSAARKRVDERHDIDILFDRTAELYRK